MISLARLVWMYCKAYNASVDDAMRVSVPTFLNLLSGAYNDGERKEIEAVGETPRERVSSILEQRYN